MTIYPIRYMRVWHSGFCYFLLDFVLWRVANFLFSTLKCFSEVYSAVSIFIVLLRRQFGLRWEIVQMGYLCVDVLDSGCWEVEAKANVL
jgi:hypothetical protein